MSASGLSRVHRLFTVADVVMRRFYVVVSVARRPKEKGWPGGNGEIYNIFINFLAAIASRVLNLLTDVMGYAPRNPTVCIYNCLHATVHETDLADPAKGAF